MDRSVFEDYDRGVWRLDEKDMCVYSPCSVCLPTEKCLARVISRVEDVQGLRMDESSVVVTRVLVLDITCSK